MRQKSVGVKISLGTAARGAALDGGCAAAARRVVWRRCGRAGLRWFLPLRARRLGNFATDRLQDDVVEVSAVESLMYGCVGDRWLVREDSFFDGC